MYNAPLQAFSVLSYDNYNFDKLEHIIWVLEGGGSSNDTMKIKR